MSDTTKPVDPSWVLPFIALGISLPDVLGPPRDPAQVAKERRQAHVDREPNRSREEQRRQRQVRGRRGGGR